MRSRLPTTPASAPGRPVVPTRSRTTVAIVDDHVLFAEALGLALTMDGYDVRQVALPTTPVTVGTLAAHVVREHPSIVLLDLDLGRAGDGTRLIEPLARAHVDVVVVTSAVGEARWGQVLAYGARAVVSKARPLGEIAGVVRRLSGGLSVLDVAEKERLVRLWHTQERDTAELRERIERLSEGERRILGHLMRGRTVREIAAVRYVSESTVRTQVKAILAKLQVSSQITAVGIAYRVGWQPPAD